MIPEGSDVLLDTNVLVHVIRHSRCGLRVLEEFDLLLRASTPIISYVTLAELYSLGRQNGWGEKKMEFIETIRMNLIFAPIERKPILDAYVEMDAFAVRKGKAIGKNDLWIAATSKATDSFLMTTDKDFEPLRERFLDLILIDQKNGEVIRPG